MPQAGPSEGVRKEWLILDAYDSVTKKCPDATRQRNSSCWYISNPGLDELINWLKLRVEEEDQQINLVNSQEGTGEHNTSSHGPALENCGPADKRWYLPEKEIN